MITIACKDCGTAIRVAGEPEELSHLLGEQSDWYPDKYPCPAASCNEKAELVDSIEPSAIKMLSVYDLTLHEAFAAFHGLGLPEERECGPTSVLAAFERNGIPHADVKLIKGSNRSVIYSITLADGTRIYLGSSPFGATIYRISELQSAVKRINAG